MALNINGRMKVKTLRADFKKEFGLNLRIYVGVNFADDDATLASIRKGDSKGGEFSPQRNTKVGNFEDKIMDMFGIKTQVSGSDDSYLCDNDKTLAGALDVDEKLMIKRANRSTVVAEDTSGSDKKRYFEIEVTGNGGEYTAGTITEENEIDYLRLRAQEGDLDLVNENFEYDEEDDDSIPEVPCFERDNILHSYGINLEDNFSVNVKELEDNVTRNYKSDTIIWRGSNEDISASVFYNPSMYSYADDSVILKSISSEEDLSIKYLLTMDDENFDSSALIFAATLMDEMMDGIEDTILDDIYYIPKQKLYEYIENLNSAESEIYNDILEGHKENLDNNYGSEIGSFIQELFEEIKENRGLDSGQHVTVMVDFLSHFKLEEIETDPGESTSIDVKLKDSEEGDFVDDDMFDDDEDWEMD